MSTLNYFLDNQIIFYGIFAGVACHLGFSFLNSYLHSSTSINTQTPNLTLVKEINGGSQVESSTADEEIEVVVDNLGPTTTINLDAHQDVIVTGISTVNDSTFIEGFVRGTDELVKLAQLFGS